MKRVWRNHSRTIVGLTIGSITIIASRFYWPDGGTDFDIATTFAAILLGFGVQGILDYCFREISKPED